MKGAVALVTGMAPLIASLACGQTPSDESSSVARLSSSPVSAPTSTPASPVQRPHPDLLTLPCPPRIQHRLREFRGTTR